MGGDDGGLADALAAAEQMIADGEAADAIETFTAIIGELPDSPEAWSGLIRARSVAGDAAAASATLSQVPPAIAGSAPVEAARAQLELARQAANAGPAGRPCRPGSRPIPRTSRRGWNTRRRCMPAGQVEEAVEVLLDSFRRDREWNDGAAKAQLLHHLRQPQAQRSRRPEGTSAPVVDDLRLSRCRKRFDLPDRIPIFPLPGAVLMPRARLPLHIFEPRYLQMLEDTLKTDHRLIGMIQPEGDGLAAIGCAGRVIAFSETDDGRMMVSARRRVAVPPAGRGRGLHALSARPHRLVLVQPRHRRAPRKDPGLDRQALFALLARFMETEGLSTDWDAASRPRTSC